VTTRAQHGYQALEALLRIYCIPHSRISKHSNECEYDGVRYILGRTAGEGGQRDRASDSAGSYLAGRVTEAIKQSRAHVRSCDHIQTLDVCDKQPQQLKAHTPTRVALVLCNRNHTAGDGSTDGATIHLFITSKRNVDGTWVSETTECTRDTHRNERLHDFTGFSPFYRVLLALPLQTTDQKHLKFL
jgi:hypothetical protein